MLIRIGVAIILLGLSVPAQAQIYSWSDANGHQVLSNKRVNGSALLVASYAVPLTQGIRVTRSAVSARAAAFDNLISEHSKNHGVRADLVRAVMQVESGFNPYARSPKGAMGLMQLMPATAKQYGVRDAFNPAENVRAGVAYLRELLDRYSNNEELALAAYNAGPGAVDKHHQSIPPYRETQSYVTRINKMAGRQAAPRDKTIFKGTDVTNDGRAIPSYSNTRH